MQKHAEKASNCIIDTHTVVTVYFHYGVVLVSYFFSLGASMVNTRLDICFCSFLLFL